MPTDNIKSEELLFVDNYPSWRKVWMLMRFYWPELKRGAILYPLVVIAIFAVSILLKAVTGEWHDKLLWWPMSLMMLCSPILLTRHDYRRITAQLPATATDKLGFLLLVFWVAFPLIIYVATLICVVLTEYILHYDISELLAMADVSGHEFVIGIVVSYSLIAISLYYAVTSKANRAGAAIISVFAYYIGLIVAVGLLCFIVGICVGLSTVMSGGTVAAELPDPLVDVEQVSRWGEYVSLATTAIFAIIAVGHIIKLHKKLRNCGF